MWMYCIFVCCELKRHPACCDCQGELASTDRMRPNPCVFPCMCFQEFVCTSVARPGIFIVKGNGTEMERHTERWSKVLVQKFNTNKAHWFNNWKWKLCVCLYKYVSPLIYHSRTQSPTSSLLIDHSTRLNEQSHRVTSPPVWAFTFYHHTPHTITDPPTHPHTHTVLFCISWSSLWSVIMCVSVNLESRTLRVKDVCIHVYTCACVCGRVCRGSPWMLRLNIWSAVRSRTLLLINICLLTGCLSSWLAV